MKKINSIIAILAAAAGFVGCVNEQPQVEGKQFTVKATTADVTKTTLDSGYNVLWAEGDEILFVYDEDESQKFVFELTSGAGTTEGTFTIKEGQDVPEIGNYTVYYPATYDGTDWPDQTYVSATDISGAPMKASGIIDDDVVTDLHFKNEGSVLEYTVKGSKTLSSISIQAEGLHVTLDCDDVQLSGEGTVFHIAVPVGSYTGATLTFTANDNTAATLNASAFNVERNKVYRATFDNLDFEALPDFTGAWFFEADELYTLSLSEDGTGTLDLQSTGNFNITWSKTSYTEGTISLSAFGTWPGTIQIVEEGLKVVFEDTPLGPVDWTFARVNPLFVGRWYGEIPGVGSATLKINEDGTASMLDFDATWQATSATEAAVAIDYMGSSVPGSFTLSSSHKQLTFAIPALGYNLSFSKKEPAPQPTEFEGAWFYKAGLSLYTLILNEDGTGSLNDFAAAWTKTSDTEGTISITISGTPYSGTVALTSAGLKVVLPTSPLGPVNWTLSRVNPLFVGTWYASVPGEGLLTLEVYNDGTASLIEYEGQWQATSEKDATVQMVIEGQKMSGTFELNEDHDQLTFSIPDMGEEFIFKQEEPEKFLGTWYGESSGSGAIRDNYTLVLNDDGTGTYSAIRIFEETDVFYYIKWTKTSDKQATIEFYESESAATPKKIGDLKSDGVELRLYDGGELITYHSFYRDDPKKDFEHLGTWYSVSGDGYTLVLNADYTGTYSYNEGETVVWTQIVKWSKFSVSGALLDFYESEQSVEPVKSGKVMMWAGGFMRLYTSDGDEKFFATTEL